MTKSLHFFVALVLVGSLAARAQGQAPAAGRGTGPAPARGGGGGQAYPPRPPVDAAILERGKAIYGVNCAFCHGADARGGDGGGPNLLRSQLVLSDQKGELIAGVIRSGRPGPPAMPPLALTDAQIADLADYLHSFPVGGYDISRDVPKSIVVGDAAAGAAAFQARCASCHSTTGDLKGIGSRFVEPRDLQDYWLVPSAGGGRGGRGTPTVRPATVAVTLPSGEKIEGRLIRIDDFIVTLTGPDGMPRSFARSGDSPKVSISDPMKPHRDLLPKYTDKEIHDITAYLVTTK